MSSDSGDLGLQLHEFREGSQYLGFHGGDLTQGLNFWIAIASSMCKRSKSSWCLII